MVRVGVGFGLVLKFGLQLGLGIVYGIPCIFGVLVVPVSFVEYPPFSPDLISLDLRSINRNFSRVEAKSAFGIFSLSECRRNYYYLRKSGGKLPGNILQN